MGAVAEMKDDLEMEHKLMLELRAKSVHIWSKDGKVAKCVVAYGVPLLNASRN